MDDRTIAVICSAVGLLLLVIIGLLGHWFLGLVVCSVCNFASDTFSWEADKKDIAERKSRNRSGFIPS